MVWLSGRGMRFFSFQKHSDRLWDPPVQWETRALLLGHEADCSSLSSAEVKNEWSSTSVLSYTFMVCTGTSFIYIKKW